MNENHHQLKAEAEAAELLDKPQLASQMVRRARDRLAVHRGRLAKVKDELDTLIRLASAWATGRYRKLPVSTLMAVLAALVYFLMPLDSIPDFIWALGFIDDIAVITNVFRLFRNDIQAFRDWEASQEETEQERTVSGETKHGD